MLKAVKAKKYSLNLLGEVNADMEDVINQATAFMCKCYSMSNTASMTEARIKVWTARIRRKAASKISLAMLFTTNHRSFSAQCEKSSLPMCYLEESPYARATKFGSYRIWVV